MAITHSLLMTCTAGGTSDSATVSNSDASETNLSETITTGQSAYQINVAIDVSEIASLYILSDQDITVKTNSSGAPDNTLALKANEPVVWWDTCLHACLLTVDVTKIYVANASGSTATLKIHVLQDSTP